MHAGCMLLEHAVAIKRVCIDCVTACHHPVNKPAAVGSAILTVVKQQQLGNDAPESAQDMAWPIWKACIIVTAIAAGNQSCMIQQLYVVDQPVGHLAR